MKKTGHQKFAALIEWRRSTRFPKGASPRAVKESLGGEELNYKDIPKRFYDDVVAFRHCTQKRRQEIVTACFFAKIKPSKKEPRKRVREPEPEGHIFAVCGYLSQRCVTMKEAKDWLDDRLLRNTYPRGFIVDGRVTVVEKHFQGLKRMVMR